MKEEAKKLYRKNWLLKENCSKPQGVAHIGFSLFI
jgi:hypothetical protein